MILKVLATGSKGNAYVLQSGHEILLLDAGIGARDIMRSLGPDFRDVMGVLLTHEHQDHSRGVRDLMLSGVDVYTSSGTARASGIDEGYQKNRLQLVRSKSIYQIGRFIIVPFDTEHDAEQPYGFLIRHSFTGETLLFATDTYYLRNTFPGVHYWLVECNHCRSIMDEQAAQGELARAMRKRLITSHMSLERLLDCLEANDLSKTRKIVLLHMSDERSDEEEMVQRVHRATGVDTIAAEAGMEIDLSLHPF